MKVRTRLSLYCSLIYGIIFAFISFLIYGLYSKNAERTIYDNLNKTAYIAALFYLEEDELNAREFDKIREQFEEFVSDSYYLIYNEGNQIAYGHAAADVPVTTLDRIRKVKRLSFSTDEYLCHGIFYEDNQGDFVVIAKESKNALNAQKQLLLWILIPLFLLGAIAIIFLSRWVSRIAYRPFSRTINEVNNISTNNLDVQIQSPQTKDELQDLIDTFNNLLEKISETVVIQQNFVRYVSHEFKTPLASMLGNLDLFSLKERTPEEYQQLSENLMQQIFQMEEILNTLIIVSDLKKDEQAVTQTRIDELIWEIIHKVKNLHPASKVRVNINIAPEDEALMFAKIDRTQLLIALFNLLENAVKYSQKESVDVELSKREATLCLSITDKGIGIPAEQLSHVSKPFYRADNTNEIQGNGIGLSLALRIFDKNKINYHIESQTGVGTQVTILFQEREDDLRA